MSETTIPSLKTGHQIITPKCRENRGILGAYREAAERMEETFRKYGPVPENDNVTWHLVLVRDDAPEPEF